jgi:hypothetical protein
MHVPSVNVTTETPVKLSLHLSGTHKTVLIAHLLNNTDSTEIY